ncbi:MAG TPA: lactate utilization protein [Candidatus Acidoferrum sp.]|nr:lactate utilization protein [Candidatus Acidoferrum sp.]
MSERDNILGRVREALRVPVPAGATAKLPDVSAHRRVMPAVGPSAEEQWRLFEKNAAELRADFRVVADQAAFGAELKALCAAEHWQRVASHKGELTDPACRALGLPVLFTDAPFDKRELAGCDAGITECDALVAQTGTVVVTSRSTGGRALSVLPPHHVVLARRAQLVADLPAAFEALKARYGANYPSMVSLITGPSRTGDIERILVLGAHGPKKLTILCCP